MDIQHWPANTLYHDTWHAMREYTDARTATSNDAIWLLEHAPVYTLGQAGLPSHIVHAGNIPVVHSDRGGQVTYHGPGQIMAYCLWDLRRLGIYVKEYVALLERAIIRVLNNLGVSGACLKPGAPGVYVPLHDVPALASDSTDLAKIAAIGVKIRKGCSYHGLALNVAMDLTPFAGINPCGYQGMITTDLQQCGVHVTMEEVSALVQRVLIEEHAKLGATV